MFTTNKYAPLPSSEQEEDVAEVEPPQHYSEETCLSRLSIIVSIPHLIAFLSLLVLSVYVAIVVHSETARQLRSEDLAHRCAFVYLVTSNRSDLDNLGFSLQSLNNYYNVGVNYRIIIVHEDIPPVVQGRLQALSEAPLQFREFQLETPLHLNLSESVNSSIVQTSTKWKRQSMIRFWFYITALAEPSKSRIFKDIDYIVRLNADSAIKGEISRDIIKDFVVKGMQYGYQKIGKDCNENVTFGLRQLAESYVELNGISPRSEDLWTSLVETKPGDCVPKFENHFEVINLRFFHSHSGIQDWIKVVEANGGIYRHRWGDGVLRYITIALYAAPEKLISYGANVMPFSRLRSAEG